MRGLRGEDGKGERVMSEMTSKAWPAEGEPGHCVLCWERATAALVAVANGEDPQSRSAAEEALGALMAERVKRGIGEVKT